MLLTFFVNRNRWEADYLYTREGLKLTVAAMGLKSTLV
jgi:hypothetical protein